MLLIKELPCVSFLLFEPNCHGELSRTSHAWCRYWRHPTLWIIVKYVRCFARDFDVFVVRKDTSTRISIKQINKSASVSAKRVIKKHVVMLFLIAVVKCHKHHIRLSALLSKIQIRCWEKVSKDKSNHVWHSKQAEALVQQSYKLFVITDSNPFDIFSWKSCPIKLL